MERHSGQGGQIRRARLVREQHGAEIASDYSGGERLVDLARKWDLCESTVARIVRANGGQVRKKGFGSDPVRFTMDGNPAWKSGRVMKDGYVVVLLAPDSPWMPMAGSKRYVLEHRLVMAQMINRLLDPDETVHHIDGNRSNNAPSNLQLRRGKHGTGVHLACADCGSRNVGAVPL